MRLAFRFARRELRGGVRGLWIVTVCLTLGVGVIAAVGTLRSAVDAGLAADGRALLGGDLEIDSGSQPPPRILLDWLHARGAATSCIMQMRSMLVAPSGERQLIELKAVDHAWPLVGKARIEPPGPVQQALAGQAAEPGAADHQDQGRNREGSFVSPAQDGETCSASARPAVLAGKSDPGTASVSVVHRLPGLLAERVVLDRLGVHAGDTVRLGAATMRVGGVLTAEPDRVATPSLFGPRALISLDALPATGLIAPGSMLRHAVRVVFAADGPAITAEAISAAFPGQGWRIRDPSQAAPGVTRFINQIGLFLTLVGLTSLLVGGIGVANGVRAWLDARARSIAILRCLGASSRLVFAVCLIQVMSLALGGIVIGLAVGGALPLLAASLLRDVLPVPPVLGVYPAPLLLAASYGVLIALAFAIWPLGRAARIPGGALFRDALLPERTRPTAVLIATNVVLGLMLIALTIGAAADRAFAVYFCAAAAGTLVLFRLGAFLLMRLARAAPRAISPWFRAPWFRLGLANLHRPGAPTPMLMLSVGLGLSTLAAVALIQGNMRREIMEQMPANAPSFFFVDIQNDQLDRFARLARAQPGASDVKSVPSLRARVVAVNGVPAEQAVTTPDTAWALRGDRGLTYAATPPAGTRLVAGSWWPPDYNGPPLVSFDANLAKGWHVGIGDTIRVNVLGRDIDLEIANLRDIAWQSLSINFFMIASPGLLAHAPHTNIATVRVTGADQGAFLRTITDALPNVTGIRVEDVLAAIAVLLDQVAAALAATGLLTLAAGILVLIGAVAAGQRHRTREAVILKILGATRRQIRAAWLVEFGILGVAAGTIAGGVGAAASFGVMHYILHTHWSFLPGTLISSLTVALATMLFFGYAGVAIALRAKPAPMLRNE
jgi:putative ABC transport system permease protein